MVDTKFRGYSNSGRLSEGEYSMPFFCTRHSPSHNSIRLEAEHFLNTLALTVLSFSGRFVFAVQKHSFFFASDPLVLICMFVYSVIWLYSVGKSTRSNDLIKVSNLENRVISEGLSIFLNG